MPTVPARVRVTTLATTVHSPWAACDVCDWCRNAYRESTWPAMREAARRHAASTGHTVSAEYRTAHVYGVTATGPA